MHHAFFKSTPGRQSGRAGRAPEANKWSGAEHGGMNEPACGLIHGQGAQAMAEKCERPVQQFAHLGDEPSDELFHVGDRRFGDTAETTGRLDGDHLDGRIDELRPAAIDGGATAGKRKAEQPKPGNRARTHDDEPTVRGTLARGTAGLDHDRLRADVIVGHRLRSERPTRWRNAGGGA